MMKILKFLAKFGQKLTKIRPKSGENVKFLVKLNKKMTKILPKSGENFKF